MLRRCYAILLGITLFLPVLLYGQEQKSLWVLADEAYQRQQYAVADALYTKLINKRQKNATVDVLEKVAESCSKIGLYDDAGTWYQQLVERTDCPPVAFLEYGEVLKSAGKYAEAKEQIAKFTSKKADSLRLRGAMMAGCDSAIAWKAVKVDMAMQNIKELSSPGSDYVSGVTRQGLLLVSNGYRKMTMNTNPEKNPAIDTRTNQPYFKPYIFKQYSQGVANTFVEEVLPDLLGSVPYHVGPVCFNAREDTVYVTLNSWSQDIANKKKTGPVNGDRTMMVFWSVKSGDTWRPLEPLREINATGSSSGQVALSRDGQTMYFASDRHGSVGKFDIWYSEKQKTGRWGKPKNCGPSINTPFDDAFPTYNEDGILYFSSKGWPGMGGFDLFRATGSKDTWTLLQNMRAPFNSGGDDIGFVMKANMYEGYFSSNRTGGGGSDDVYRFMDTHFAERFDGTGGIHPYDGTGQPDDHPELADVKKAKKAEPEKLVLSSQPDDSKPEREKRGKKHQDAPVADKTKVKQTRPEPTRPEPATVPAPVVADVPTVKSPMVPVSAPITESKSAPVTSRPEPEVVSPRQPVTVPISDPLIGSNSTSAPEKPAVAETKPAKTPARPKETPTRGKRGAAAVIPASVTEPVPAPEVAVAKTEKTERTAIPAEEPAQHDESDEDKKLDNAIMNKMEKLQFFYDYNSAVLTTKSRDLLDRVAVVLNQFPTWKLMVRSYTDSRGSDAYNKDLSALRCYAVIDYLIKKGVASNRLYYENIGKDPEDPCGKGVPCTERQYLQSRRTMLKIIQPGDSTN